MDPDSEAIVCDNSMRFSEGTFIRIITRIIIVTPPSASQNDLYAYDHEDHGIVIAKGLPMAEGKSEVLIHPVITVD
jgi:hypothetical protein